jgi:hypothetical protein
MFRYLRCKKAPKLAHLGKSEFKMHEWTDQSKTCRADGPDRQTVDQTCLLVLRFLAEVCFGHWVIQSCATVHDLWDHVWVGVSIDQLGQLV